VSERFLSVKEVCTQLGVGPKSVRFYIRSGQLPATNVARNPAAKRATWRVSESSLRQFELSRRAIADEPSVGRIYRPRQPQIVDRY
jgi:hypothetical protein